MSNLISSSKRIMNLIKVSALPASIISFIGDILTPKHGEMVVLILGILGMLLFLYLLYTMKYTIYPWWLKFFKENKDLMWMWQGNKPIYTHGLQSILVFSIICLISGCSSLYHKQDNGYLSNKYNMVESIQSTLGILEKNLEAQKEILKQQQEINNKADNFKQETSQNPRKELNNLGVIWSKERYLEAIDDDDQETVILFIKGGMDFTDTEMLHVLDSNSVRVSNSISEMHPKIDNLTCEKIIDTTINTLASPFYSFTDNDQLHYISFVSKLCKTSKTSRLINNLFLEEKKIFEKEANDYKEWYKNRKSIQSKCLKDNNINKVLDEYKKYKPSGNRTLTSKEYLMEQISIEYSTSVDKNSFIKNINEIIDNYCIKETKVNEPESTKLYILDIFNQVFNKKD